MNLAFYSMLTLTIFSVLALAILYLHSRSPSTLSARTFNRVIAPRRPLERVRITGRTSAQLLAYLRLLRASFARVDDPELVLQFEHAALPTSPGLDLYFAARFGGPVLMLLLGAFSPRYPLLVMCVGAGLAWLAPPIVLTRLVKSHREQVRLAIPDAVDLLVICVDSGLGLDQAMARVGEELLASYPALHHEIAQIGREQRAGSRRLDAWRDMAARTELAETEALVNLLMQTERFGTPIARALSNFGDTTRQKRRQLVEELAAKTAIKIIFPLVFFIFPCIFIVLLGPAAITLYRSMASGTP